MRATELIRAVLDLIDQSETDLAMDPRPDPTEIKVDVVPNEPGEQTSRFRQIFHLLSQRNKPRTYSNSPRDAVADIAAVTTDAGGGWNGSKHPDDIRIKDPRGFDHE